MSNVSEFALKHDREGRIVEKVETVNTTSRQWTCAYDKEGRLFEARLKTRIGTGIVSTTPSMGRPLR